MTTINVRRANSGDLAALATLFDGYRMFYGQASDPAGARRFLEARLQQEESVVFIAFSDGCAVGFTQLFPIFSSVRMRRLWLLNDLFVSADARRLGVATELMNAARKHAEATRAAGVLLETGIENVNAQVLYEKLGYRRNETTWYYELSLD